MFGRDISADSSGDRLQGCVFTLDCASLRHLFKFAASVLTWGSTKIFSCDPGTTTTSTPPAASSPQPNRGSNAHKKGWPPVRNNVRQPEYGCGTYYRRARRSN